MNNRALPQTKTMGSSSGAGRRRRKKGAEIIFTEKSA